MRTRIHPRTAAKLSSADDVAINVQRAAPYSLLSAPYLVEIHTNVVRARFLGLHICFFIVKL